MRLKNLREDSDIPQRVVAEFLNIKQNTYSQYENGQRQIPLDLLVKLAEYFNVSTDYILGITDIKSPYPKGWMIFASVQRAICTFWSKKYQKRGGSDFPRTP